MLAQITSHPYFATASIVLTFAGVALAIIQTVRYRRAQQLLKTLEENREKSLWATVSLVLQTYDLAEELRSVSSAEPINRQQLGWKLGSLRRSVVNNWLQLIVQAAAEAPEFGLETVQRWHQLGRLENQWRLKQVVRLVPEKRISEVMNADSLIKSLQANTMSNEEFDNAKLRSFTIKNEAVAENHERKET